MRKLDNWLKSYLTYTSESAAPDSFHLWCGVSALASVMQRSVYYATGYFNMYPNQYVTLVSPPGICHKSTSMRMVREILVPAKINMGADSTSREKFVNELMNACENETSAITVHSSEFGSFLSTSEDKMVMFLNDIYDSPPNWVHSTKKDDRQVIQAPCVNLLAGTTPRWLSTGISADVAFNGLTARTIYVYADRERKQKKAFPKITKTQRLLGQVLGEDLAYIKTIKGEFILDPEADEWFDEWVSKHKESAAYLSESVVASYFRRKDTHIIKVAMCVSIAEKDELILTKANMLTALAMLDKLEPSMQKVFSGIGKNPLNLDYEEVLSKLFFEGVSYSKLLNEMRYSVKKDELDDILLTLTSTGHITLDKGIYRLTATHDAAS